MQLEHAGLEHAGPVALVKQEGDAVDAILVPPCLPYGLRAKLDLRVSCAPVRVRQHLLTVARET